MMIVYCTKLVHRKTLQKMHLGVVMNLRSY